jgi:hypothetical protein
MKKYLYLLPFFALIDAMTSFAPAAWVLGQQVLNNDQSNQNEYMAAIFCSVSSLLILVLLIYSVVCLAMAAPLSITSAKFCTVFMFTCGLLYLILGIYSLITEPAVLASDFFSMGQSDADYFRRLVKFSGFQIWCIALSALAMALLNFDKLSSKKHGDTGIIS